MTAGKKIGYFCLTFTPLIVYLLISVAVSVGAGVFIALISLMTGEGLSVDAILNQTMIIGTIYAAIGIVVMGLWHYFGLGHKQLKPQKGVITLPNIILIVVLSFAMQYVISLFVSIVGAILPQALETYTELVESAIVPDNAFTYIYGVILGPIAEELTFRGVTMHYAKRFTKHFWIANMLQALAFGIMHLNLIQGAYAFLLGLLLGWLYEEHQSMHLTIWMHIVFNFLGVGILEKFDAMLPGSDWFYAIWILVMCVLTVITTLGLRKKKEAEKTWEE